MELEGNLVLERARTRRWVSIVGVIIPVAAVVLLAAWFVRVYVVPPTIVIPGPLIVADDPPAPAAVARAQIEAPRPAMATAGPAASPPSGERRAPASSALPMFATLAIVPPTLSSTPRPFADPAQESSRATPSIMVEEPAALPSAEPIAGPIPLPRTKPHGSLALVTGAIPLPRPRPVEVESPLNDLPAVDRHGIP